LIETSFLQFTGIGKKTLSKLLDAGYTNWSSVIENPYHLPFGSGMSTRLIGEIHEYKVQLQKQNIAFFTDRLAAEDKWKILADYYDKISYFDIETNGNIYGDTITVIVCLHKGKFYRYVNRENIESFLELLVDVDLLVSFNGISFDIPMVQNFFNIPSIPCPHIDLRWVCYHKNLRGGLKSIEKQMNIQRPEHLDGVDGMDAIVLWHNWIKNNDVASRQLLLEYCEMDVVSLQLLTEKLINLKSDIFLSTK
jgi:uncharacterized protein